jgi:hypothetical protein
MKKGRKNYTLIRSGGRWKRVRKWRGAKVNPIKTWLHKLFLSFWPWSKIDNIEKQLKETQDLLNKALLLAECSYNDGVRWHLENWMKQSNMHYGRESFREDQRALMMKLYQDGLTYRQAVDHLRLAEDRPGFKKWVLD